MSEQHEVLSLFKGVIARPSTMREIASLVAERHGLTLNDLLGRSQAHHIAHPRQEAFALIRAQGRYSLPKIGGFFGRDHTTILFGIRQHEARLEAARTAAMKVAAE